MKTAHWLPGLLALTVTLVLSGCATPETHSFNSDYNQHLPTDPKYSIEDHGANCFKVTVEQGIPSSGQERVLDTKQAASAVAETEAKRRGWESFDLNYIYEQNQGWMHVVKAVVKPKNAVKYKGSN